MATQPMPIVLIVEQSRIEQAKARKVVIDSGFSAVVASTYQDGLRILENLDPLNGQRIAGVMTGIYLPERDSHEPALEPRGLGMILRAARRATPIPAAVCADLNLPACGYLLVTLLALDSFAQLTTAPIKTEGAFGGKDWVKVFNSLDLGMRSRLASDQNTLLIVSDFSKNGFDENIASYGDQLGF